ncbi:hypothetical protein G7Y41_08790 [Schaalia sp. ZJ405]|uniref:hypothetical protein n=1 Tax=Schaalia sp. ZJ405 TaxID=2709403 RepID=UPI0013ED5B93|nr:hypothetical protein [Schaalia sp. ZJ405]QPK81121.1 hypothetical protein G7Y41_08790 [Schaalia sp. ZJ405]
MSDTTTTSDTTEATETTQQDTGQQTVETSGKPDTTTGEAKPSKGEGLPTDIATLHEMIHHLRGEAASNRVNAKQKAAEEAEQNLARKIGQALGLTPTDDEKPSVEDLTARVAQSEAARTKAETLLAVYQAAQGIADADMLIDSASFHNTLADIDTSNPKAVADAIKAFVTEHPKFKPVQATGQSSVDHAAGSGEGHITLDQFKAMSGQERQALYASNTELYTQLADKL